MSKFVFTYGVPSSDVAGRLEPSATAPVGDRS